MKHFPQLQRAAAVKINGSSGGSSGNFSAYAAADELRSTVADTRQNQPLQIEIDDRECWLCVRSVSFNKRANFAQKNKLD